MLKAQWGFVLIVVCGSQLALADSPDKEQSTDRESALLRDPAALRAVAWMEDYFATSVEFSPEQADQLREEIHSLPPDRVAGWVEDFQRERGLYRPRSEQASDAAQLYKQHAVAVQLASLKAARQSSRAPDLAVQQQLGRQAVKEMYQYEMGMQRRASQAQILAERYNGFGTRAWLYLSILND